MSSAPSSPLLCALPLAADDDNPPVAVAPLVLLEAAFAPVRARLRECAIDPLRLLTADFALALLNDTKADLVRPLGLFILIHP